MRHMNDYKGWEVAVTPRKEALMVWRALIAVRGSLSIGTTLWRVRWAGVRLLGRLLAMPPYSIT